MTRDDVRNLMHEYFGNLLSPDERRSIESYLEEYPEVAQEYELMRKLLEKSRTIPIGIKVPDTVLKKISDELLSQTLEERESQKQQILRELTENTEKEGEKRKKIKNIKGKTAAVNSVEPKRKSFYKPSKLVVIIVLAVIIAIAGYFVSDYFNHNLPWKLHAEYGQYQVGSSYSSKTIDENETLSTLDSAKVTIDVPNTGKINVLGYSSVEILKGRESDNIVSLRSGKIDIKCKPDHPLLTINTRPVNAVSRGGDFSMELDNNGNVFVETGNGLVELKNNNEEMLLAKNHYCVVESSGKMTVPYNANINPELKELISQIILNGELCVNVDKLLSVTTMQDGLTLLYLIKEVDNKTYKTNLFLKLDQFFPPPPGVTQEGIINHDKKMFDTWVKDIQWQL